MEWVRVLVNPWGEEVPIGMGWDIAWLVLVAGALFVAGHAIFARKHAPLAPGDGTGVPAEVKRHNLSARISHWIIAAATFALLITAFVPMLGLDFPWLTIHWVSGVIFGLYLVYHIVDTAVRLSWGKMWIGIRETGEAFSRTADFFKRTESAEKRPGKWGMENKIFHHATAVAGLAVLATGILMMGRVDTWFWAADPYRWNITDANWGWIFVIHGASALAFVGLLIAHIYFAVRPDKFYLTLSMIRGWIPRHEYLTHFSRERWPVSKNESAPVEPRKVEVPVGAGSGPNGD
jgi:formate dehydrogenase subunit gamma